jgi:hypothetical protein
MPGCNGRVDDLALSLSLSLSHTHTHTHTPPLPPRQVKSTVHQHHRGFLQACLAIPEMDTAVGELRTCVQGAELVASALKKTQMLEVVSGGEGRLVEGVGCGEGEGRQVKAGAREGLHLMFLTRWLQLGDQANLCMLS